MLRFPSSCLRISACIALVVALFGCSPTFDWREVRGKDTPYTVLFPAKPSSSTRSIDLDGMKVSMTMTAAEAGDALFAVGAAQLPDAAAAQRALPAMKIALLKNIGGTVRRETPPQADGSRTTLELEAAGAADRRTGGQPRVLFARFIAAGPRIYQLVVTGKDKAISPETVDTFFSSFKPE